MLRFAVRMETPVAIRYPRGTAYDEFQEYRAPIAFGKSEAIYEEDSIALVSVGHMFENAVKAREIIKDTGYNWSLVNARFVKPLDEEMIVELAKDHRLIVTIEENVASGGFGDRVLEVVNKNRLDVKVLNITLPDDYIEHGSVKALREEVLLDPESIAKRAITAYIV